MLDTAGGAAQAERAGVCLSGWMGVSVEAGGASIRTKLLEPLGAGSPIAAFLEKNPAGGLHHVCYEVEDIEAAAAAVAAQGARVLGAPRIGAHGKPVVFVHPKDIGGVLTELEQV